MAQQIIVYPYARNIVNTSRGHLSWNGLVQSSFRCIISIILEGNRMDSITVSELPLATTLNDNGRFYYVDENGNSKKVTFQKVRESIMA